MSAPWKLVQQINTIQPAYTKYESSSEHQEIVLMEVESVDHRGAVKNEFFIQLFQEELYWMARKEFLTNPNFFGKHQGKSSAIVQEIWSKSIMNDATPPTWIKDFTEDDDPLEPLEEIKVTHCGI